MKLNLHDFAVELTADRCKNQELSPGIRAAICTLVAAGRSERSVAELFRVSRDAITKAIDLWKTQRTFEIPRRTGCPSILTQKEKRYIITLVKRNRNLAKKALIEATEKKISYSTIKRCLRTHNLRK